MENIDFLAKILRSDQYYWLVAKKNIARIQLESKRVEDNIMLICVDEKFGAPRGEDEITLSLLKSLQRSEPPNVFLCNSYSPFQTHISMYEIYDGEPVPYNHVNRFMKSAIEVESRDLWEYKKLLKSMIEPLKEETKEQ